MVSSASNWQPLEGQNDSTNSGVLARIGRGRQYVTFSDWIWSITALNTSRVQPFTCILQLFFETTFYNQAHKCNLEMCLKKWFSTSYIKPQNQWKSTFVNPNTTKHYNQSMAAKRIQTCSLCIHLLMGQILARNAIFTKSFTISSVTFTTQDKQVS